MRPHFFILTILLAGCGLTLDLDPPDQGMDAGPPEDFDAGDPPVEEDAGEGMDAAFDAAMDAGGVVLDADTPFDGPTPVDADVMPGDANVLLDGSRACIASPTNCFSNSDCSPIGEICLRPRNRCLGPGTCVLPTAGCPKEIVCGCNANTYPSPCAAHLAGVSVAYAGPCLGEASLMDDWCTGAPPSRDNRICDRTLPACFDDADCGLSFFTTCVGATGCSPGQEGYCYGPGGPGECLRDSECGPGRTCQDVDVSLLVPEYGNCTF